MNVERVPAGGRLSVSRLLAVRSRRPMTGIWSSNLNPGQGLRENVRDNAIDSSQGRIFVRNHILIAGLLALATATTQFQTASSADESAKPERTPKQVLELDIGSWDVEATVIQPQDDGSTRKQTNKYDSDESFDYGTDSSTSASEFGGHGINSSITR